MVLFISTRLEVEYTISSTGTDDRTNGSIRQHIIASFCCYRTIG